ncbi:MAG TPA: class I SAM-dependent methyltransferase [Acidimicrobiales bacterium]|nr:class I SAM-dependent methyltransferase [Acidimicrobiales bacterium]
MPDDEVRRWRRAVRRIPLIDRVLRAVRRTDEIEALQEELAQQRRLLSAQSATAPKAEQWCGRIMDESATPFLSWRPPGHYYSPVPTMREIMADQDRIFTRPDFLTGLDLNADAQLALFRELAPLAGDVTFNTEPLPDRRYFTNNPSYGVGDGLILQAFLRLLRPKRYLEVGSGWTTALTLDTNDRWLDGRLHLTCIEPYPDDLSRLVRPDDNVEIIVSPVQGVDIARFTELEPGDILFIDCSHVVRTGSDAHHLITRVLPVVPSGIYIHIHDMFWPFEYPRQWVEEGRAWSESYLLHAFLLFNREFEIVLFNDWLSSQHYETMVHAVPALADGAGGALWLRRR